jgi:hypothetical protein
MAAASGTCPAYYSIPGSNWPGEAWPGNAAPLTLPETGFALGEPYLGVEVRHPWFSAGHWASHTCYRTNRVIRKHAGTRRRGGR